MFKSTILGRMTNKPELKQGKQKNYCQFVIASRNEGVNDKTSFIICKIFGSAAEEFCKRVDTGDEVLIIGDAVLNELIEGDKKRYYLEIFVRNFKVFKTKVTSDQADQGSIKVINGEI